MTSKTEIVAPRDRVDAIVVGRRDQHIDSCRRAVLDERWRPMRGRVAFIDQPARCAPVCYSDKIKRVGLVDESAARVAQVARRSGPTRPVAAQKLR